MRPLPAGQRQIVSAGVAGFFVLQVGRRLELWDMRAGKRIEVLVPRFSGYYKFVVQGDALYLVKPKSITVLDGCLAGLASRAAHR
jgi:hypothetical protein